MDFTERFENGLGASLRVLRISCSEAINAEFQAKRLVHATCRASPHRL
jgi:hypothetical protein